jgi:hypothetical protein
MQCPRYILYQPCLNYLIDKEKKVLILRCGPEQGTSFEIAYFNEFQVELERQDRDTDLPLYIYCT